MKNLLRNLLLLSMLATALAGCSQEEPAPTGPPKGGEAIKDEGLSAQPGGGGAGATQSVAPLTMPGKGKKK